MDIAKNTVCKITYAPDTHFDEAEMMLRGVTQALMDAEIPFHIATDDRDFSEYVLEIRTQDHPSDYWLQEAP